jgi:hypothetical protein
MEEKWDYIVSFCRPRSWLIADRQSQNLDDFKSESCWTPFSYFFLYVFLLVSLAVYGVDIFTAVNLLAFSQWAGSIEPAIPFTVSRWIFAVCIILSFVLLVIRWLQAIRAIRSGSISHSYLDSLAVRIQSIRMGQRGRGWKRFLVFAELTKSKKGAEYVALYAYFSFETWMNTLLADGPRQVVNAITLWSVMRMDLLPGGENASGEDDKSPAQQFFENIKILAVDNHLRAVVLIGMTFTVVIWIFSILKLASAVILYLIFLFHHIPSEDGTLKAYCRRKISTRLKRIVTQKVNKALSKGLALQDRTPTQPNLFAGQEDPSLPSVGKSDTDKGPGATVLSRSTTQTTLPPYTSRPGTAAPDQNPSLPNVASFDEKPSLSRTATESSEYSESASLGGSTATAFSPLDRQNSPAPPVPPIPMYSLRSEPPVSRPPTSQSRFTPAPPPVNGAGRFTPGPGYGSPSPSTRYNPSAMGRRTPGPPVPVNGPGPFTPGPEYGSPSSSANGNPYPMGGPSPAPYRAYSPATNPYGRSLTPGAGVPPDNAPARTFSPAGYSASPSPGPPGRSFTPVGRNGISQLQKLDRYAAFDPSMTSHAAPPRNQTQSPAYHPYDGNAPRSRSPQPHF